MKAFITGATGNIGRLLVGQLLLRSWAVDALVLPEEDADSLTKEGVRVFPGDVTARASVDRAMEKSLPDVLFHLAAHVQLSIVDDVKIKERMYNVNVNGTSNVLKSALQHNVKKAVYLSSVAIFGSVDREDIITEDISPRGEDLSEYSQTKRLAYQEAMNIQEQGLPLLVFMPGIIFGPGILGTISLLESFYQGRTRNLPNNYNEINIPLTFNQDLPRAIFAGMERNKFGEKYILVGNSPTLGQILALLAEIAGEKTESESFSYRKALLEAWLMEAGNNPIKRSPRITEEGVKDLLKRSQQSRYQQQFDSSKARRELGWEPTPLREAFKETFDWFWKNYAEQPQKGGGLCPKL